MHFMALKKSRKHYGFVIYSHFKDSLFTAVKRDAKFREQRKSFLQLAIRAS